MKVVLTLVMAMDFAKRKNVPTEVYSYQRNGTWYVVRSGPKYSITFRVTEADEAGLARLKELERPEESTRAEIYPRPDNDERPPLP